MGSFIKTRKSQLQRTMAVVVGAGLTAATMLGAAGSASAEDAGTTPLRSWNNGLCLESTTGSSVVGRGCNGGRSQNWQELTPAPPDPSGAFTWAIPAQTRVGIAYHVYGYWWVKDQGTGRCLMSNTTGAVYAYPCKAGSATQLWADVRWKADDKAHTLVSMNSDRALQINSNGSVSTQPLNWTNHNVLQDLKRGL